MKKLQNILASVLALCLLGGCTIANRQDNAKPTAAIQALELPFPSRVSFCAEPADPSITSINGIAVDNTTPLEQCLTTAYPLQELQDFFGTESLHDIITFHSQRYREDAQYREDFAHKTCLPLANEHFPIEVLRYTIPTAQVDPDTVPIPTAYTAYRVLEGGLYFVLWRESLYEDPALVPGEKYYEMRVTYYLQTIPMLDSYPIPEVGTDSYAEVRAADPLAELISIYEDYYSISILRSGYWLVGRYERQTSPDDPLGQLEFTASDLLLTELFLCEPMDYWHVYLQYILYTDLFCPLLSE